MTTTATIPQVHDYLTAFLNRDSMGAITDDPRNDRLMTAIGCLEDVHEGLLASITPASGQDAGRMEENAMSNLWLNIRFGAWHLQGESYRKDWWKLRWSHNGYFADKHWWSIEIFELQWPETS